MNLLNEQLKSIRNSIEIRKKIVRDNGFKLESGESITLSDEHVKRIESDIKILENERDKLLSECNEYEEV